MLDPEQNCPEGPNAVRVRDGKPYSGEVDLAAIFSQDFLRFPPFLIPEKGR